MAKFPKPDDTRDIAGGEILALTLAAQAGIQVAEHRLVPAGGHSVAVITRFDREGKNRIPFISAATLLGLPQGDPGAYTLLADGIRQFGHDGRPVTQRVPRRPQRCWALPDGQRSTNLAPGGSQLPQDSDILTNRDST